MKHLSLILIAILYGLVFPTSHAESADAFSLSLSQHTALITGANKTLTDYLREPQAHGGSNIPKQFWGAAILQLNPLRVIYDRANLKIVIVDDDLSEAGFYLSVPISSYGLTTEDFPELVLLTTQADKSLGSLYRYRISKPKATK